MSETRWTKGDWTAQKAGFTWSVRHQKCGVCGDWGVIAMDLTEASAHLIAAAPAMYSELNQLAHAAHLQALRDEGETRDGWLRLAKSADVILSQARGAASSEPKEDGDDS